MGTSISPSVGKHSSPLDAGVAFASAAALIYDLWFAWSIICIHERCRHYTVSGCDRSDVNLCFWTALFFTSTFSKNFTFVNKQDRFFFSSPVQSVEETQFPLCLMSLISFLLHSESFGTTWLSGSLGKTIFFIMHRESIVCFWQNQQRWRVMGKNCMRRNNEWEREVMTTGDILHAITTSYHNIFHCLVKSHCNLERFIFTLLTSDTRPGRRWSVPHLYDFLKVKTSNLFCQTPEPPTTIFTLLSIGGI